LISQSLLSAGAEVTALTSAERGSTGPLFVCSEVGGKEVFDKFLELLTPEKLHEAANQKNGEDLYPVDCAAFYNEWQMVAGLLPYTDELRDTPLEEIRATAIKRREEYGAQVASMQESAEQKKAEAKELALKVKAEGNKHYIAKKFLEAVKSYDEAIGHVSNQWMLMPPTVGLVC